MSTTAAMIGFNAATTSQAAAANAAANAAARNACLVYVQGYEHNKATIIEMKEYANCIDRLYPNELSGSSLYAAKAAILFLFVAMLAGVWWGRRMSNGVLGALFFGGVIGLLFGFVVLVLLFGILTGINILIT